LVDLQYADIRPDKGLYHRLVAHRAMLTLLPEGAAAAAVDEPPQDTRAYFRGECLKRYGPSIAAASWDSVIFDVGRESLVRVPMLEPLRGTKAHVGELFERSGSAAELIDALVGPR
ncbi:MAG: proteasome accessory factor PafA2 family protein, partial [Trebonia sp.]